MDLSDDPGIAYPALNILRPFPEVSDCHGKLYVVPANIFVPIHPATPSNNTSFTPVNTASFVEASLLYISTWNVPGVCLYANHPDSINDHSFDKVIYPQNGVVPT